MVFVETSNLAGAALAMRRTNPWTDKRKELLTSLWQDGQSATYIMLKMDYPFTRNAILGKVDRMGLSKQPGGKPHAKTGIHWGNSRRPEGFRRKALPKTPRPVAEPKIMAPEIIAIVERSEAACTFAQLGKDMCRYPYGEPQDADFAFCARHTKGTYCAGHQAACHQSSVPRQDKRGRR